jgi:antitoxin VapB
MNAVNSKTFKSGNSIALRLPRALGIEADVEMRIEKDGDALVIRPAKDPAAEKAKLRRLIERLDEIGAVGEIGKRDPIEIPERPGLV